ncbi:izumo sperm-egg fusion protein 1 [Thalassophryne amazonica]|uniref:izumo sperm-egg fusion protein 1 n=1 Tax=Thalassophryne amazonica TaxID=390379 RepID=UPI00147194FB|nr:izumo sperm-egg fusion protein 1 [Thalassophryne amazonica]
MFLICCISAAQACLQCDSRIRNLHQDYILSFSSVLDQIIVTEYRDHAYTLYQQESLKGNGVVDSTTLYNAVAEYQNYLTNEIERNKPPVVSNAHYIMDRGRSILQKHLQESLSNNLCPNTCGILHQRVKNCITCKFETYVCPSHQQDCGEFWLEAEEGEAVVLNCFQNWHLLLIMSTEYHYSWAPGAPGTKKMNDSDLQGLVVTDESSVVLNQLNIEEQGTYRCTLQDYSGNIYYRVTFYVNVTAAPESTVHPFIHLPEWVQEDRSPFSKQLVSVLYVIVVLSLISSFILISIIRHRVGGRLMMKGNKDENFQRRWGDEVALPL